ncbi:hypothetical protein [Desulfovibrio desulfuricans]|uniref:hypothetical protein n=1 Tax=Desulfovibrio desulfuricans TaxID=876 RepID=UPI0035AF9815
MAIATSTAAMISAAVALAGAAAGTAGAVQQAENRRQQEEYQSELAARNAQQAELSAEAADDAARQERRAGYEAAQAKRQEAARIIGSQRAEAGASGAQTDAGSALDKNLDTAEKGELDALSAEQQGQSRAHMQDMRAWSLRNQSAEAASTADFTGSRADTDYLGLSSTLLNGAARAGRNFYTIGSRGPLLP